MILPSPPEVNLVPRRNEWLLDRMEVSQNINACHLIGASINAA